jgi:hypothetical protein
MNFYENLFGSTDVGQLFEIKSMTQRGDQDGVTVKLSQTKPK